MNDVEINDDAMLARLRREVRKRYDEIDRVTRDPELQAIPDFTSRYIGDLREDIRRLEREVLRLSERGLASS